MTPAQLRAQINCKMTRSRYRVPYFGRSCPPNHALPYVVARNSGALQFCLYSIYFLADKVSSRSHVSWIMYLMGGLDHDIGRYIGRCIGRYIGRYSVDTRPMLDRCSTDTRPMLDRCSTDARPMLDRCSTDARSILDRWSTDTRPMLDRCSTDTRPMHARVKCRLTIDRCIDRYSVDIFPFDRRCTGR